MKYVCAYMHIYIYLCPYVFEKERYIYILTSSSKTKIGPLDTAMVCLNMCATHTLSRIRVRVRVRVRVRLRLRLRLRVQ